MEGCLWKEKGRMLRKSVFYLKHLYACMYVCMMKIKRLSWEENETLAIIYFRTEGKCKKEDGCLYVCSIYFAVNILKAISFCNENLELLYWFCRTEVTK